MADGGVFAQQRTPIDIEALIQWAIAQTGFLPWYGTHPRELMLDGGYTAIPKGCSRQYHGGTILLRRAINSDAAIVIEAVKSLEPSIAAVVIARGRDKDRPQCFVGVKPKLVDRKVYGRKRGRKRHRPTTIREWNIDPKAICAAREIYTRWHAALARLAAQLQGQLIAYDIKGLGAPETPWLVRMQKSA